MEKYYWYDVCSGCDGQGRLFIMEDISNKRLYLHCEECEMGWLNPSEIKDVKKGFLTLLEDFEGATPSYEKICEMGWENYAKHCLEE